jgi:ribulose-5-phosphate 4-epimerase/fuculose-1-phosphate aldolase
MTKLLVEVKIHDPDDIVMNDLNDDGLVSDIKELIRYEISEYLHHIESYIEYDEIKVTIYRPWIRSESLYKKK